MTVNDKEELSFSICVNQRMSVEPGAGTPVVLQSETGRSPNLHSALIDARDVAMADNRSRSDTAKIRNRSARPVRSQFTMLPKINSAKLIWFVHSENADG